jgi:medium-chain acyl-[acyl-carrier-protein] hydrolase
MTFGRRPGAALKLICFTYAGGTGSNFRHWQDFLPRFVEVSAVRLPGRGRNVDAPPLGWAEIVPVLSAELFANIDRPFVFFGHSLGAILSFEVARWLRRRRGVRPQRLLVSGRRAPHLPQCKRLSCATNEDLVEKLRELKGTPLEILGDNELLEIVAPRIRADFQLADDYRYTPEPPLACPITAFGGADDEESQVERLEAWSVHTTGTFSSHLFPGDHFFLHAHERELLALINDELQRSFTCRAASQCEAEQ